MTFSIILPTYNRAKLLTRAISSIAKQGFNDLEVIIINDGSSDSTSKNIMESLQGSGRTVLIETKNGGVSRARNIGLEVATGEYVLFLDSDDEFTSYCLNTLHSFVQNSNDAEIICFGYEQDNKKWAPKRNVEQHNRNDIERYIFPEHISIRPQDEYFLQPFVWNKCLKRDFLQKYGIRFDAGRLTWEDNLFIVDCLEHCNRIKYIPKTLYRVNSDAEPTGRLFTCYNELMLLNYIQSYIDFYNRFGSKYNYENEYTQGRYIEIVCYILKQIANRCSYDTYVQCLRDVLFNGIVNDLVQKQLKRGHLNDGFLKAVDTKDIQSLSKFLIGDRYYFDSNSNRITTTGDWMKSILLNLREQVLFYNWINKQVKHSYFLLGTPVYGNVGDIAIAYAEKQFFNACGIRKERIKEINSYEFNRFRKIVVRAIKKNKNVIFLQGGGNMGNVWINEELDRRRILDLFPERTVLIFPQTVFYSDDLYGAGQLRQSIEYYNKSSISITARESETYKLVKQNYPRANIIFSPDMVLSLNDISKRFKVVDRKNVLIIRRYDTERAVDDEGWDEITQFVSSMRMHIQMTSTITEELVTKVNSKKIVMEKLKQFRSARLVITDRLHGMIFSAITETPCVVLSNNNYKVIGTYDLIKELNYIKFAKSTGEACSHIKSLLTIDPASCRFTLDKNVFYELRSFIYKFCND